MGKTQTSAVDRVYVSPS